MNLVRLLEQQSPIPVGKSGDWEVEEFEVTDEGAKFHNLRCVINRELRDRMVYPGIYTKLSRGRWLVMSDTPAEIYDLCDFFSKAKGKVLVNGLGLGVAVRLVLTKPEVEQITVIEISSDVINLVGDYIRDPRLEIIEADAFNWMPPEESMYDVVWHDIWDNICTDNLKEMNMLHCKYDGKTKWQGSWCRSICEMYRDRNY